MMIVIWSLLIVLIPLLFGEVVVEIFREKNAGIFEKYACGFISLLLMSFAVTLCTVKFRLSFDKYSLLILIIWGFALAAGAVCCVVKSRGRNKSKCGFDKFSLWYLIPAVILFVYSYLYLAPSFANDDTWEIVSTTVNTGTIYEYSAMTGEKMVNGLPIFNKIYFLPLMYAAFVGRLEIPMNLLGGVLLPLMVFVTNIGLVRKIGREVGVKNESSYMLLYMLALMGGTYLPANGIPATFGYGILREAYSGYGIFYGVVIPLATLLLLKKKWIETLLTASVSLGLLRIDRIYFALKTPVSTWNQVNSEGKMAVFTLLSLAAVLLLKALNNTKAEWKLLLCPPVFFSYATDNVQNLISGKGAKRVFLLVMGVAVIVACNFEPFKDAQTFVSYLKYEKEVAAELAKIEDRDCCILAPLEFMSVARRIDGSVRTLFGRDDVTPTMVGLDYEDSSEYVIYYYRYTLNHYLMYEPYYIPFTNEELLEIAKKEGMDYLIFP